MNNPPISSETQIVIADDHPIFRRGLKCIIETEPGLKVVAEADNGEAAFFHICRHEPDIAILDLDMPEKDGFEVTRAAQEKHLACEIIFLTMHNSESIFNAALDLGIKGYVLKDSSMSEIVDCIRAVLRGRSYVSPQLSTFLINRANRAADFARGKPALKDLTPTERRILKLISEEKTSRQIAESLFISVRTVDRHRSNICDKLELRGTNALVKFAIAHKTELK